MVLFDEVVSQAFDPSAFVRMPFDVAEKVAPTRSEFLWQDHYTQLWIEGRVIDKPFLWALSQDRFGCPSPQIGPRKQPRRIHVEIEERVSTRYRERV